MSWRIIVLLVGLVLLADVPRAFAFTETCPAGGEHTYDVEITQYPTDEAEGIRHYQCTKCGYSRDVVIPPVGHAWGPWIIDLQPTCTGEGHAYRECNKRDEVTHREERIIAPLSPTWSHAYQVTGEVAATCTQPGSVSYACSYCGEVYADETPALGHAWGEWTVTREPGKSTEGARQRVCARDATHIETGTLAAIGGEEIVVVEEVEEEAPPVVVAAEPAPEEPPAVYVQFTAFDAAFVAFDIAMLALFFVLAIPFIAHYRFNQKRRAAARAKRNQAEETAPERNPWDWPH